MTKSKRKLADILNAAVNTKSQAKIAEEAEVSSSTVVDVMKDYPLWDYFRKLNKGDY